MLPLGCKHFKSCAQFRWERTPDSKKIFSAGRVNYFLHKQRAELENTFFSLTNLAPSLAGVSNSSLPWGSTHLWWAATPRYFVYMLDRCAKTSEGLLENIPIFNFSRLDLKALFRHSAFFLTN